MSLESQYFEREIEQAEKAISERQIDLRVYAEKETATQYVIEEKSKAIDELLTLVEASRTFLAAHTDALRYEFNRGKERGRREAEIEYVLPERYYEHKETLRDLSKQRAMETQPELFKTDYQTKIFDGQN